MKAQVLQALLVAVLLIGTAVAQPRRTTTLRQTSAPYLTLTSITWVKKPERPGRVGVLRIQLANYGENVLLECRAYVDCAYGAVVITPQPVLLGAWHPGAVKSIEVALNFTNPEGYCILKINVNYDATARPKGGGFSVLTVPGAYTLSLRLDHVYTSILTVQVSPESIYSGTVNEVSLKVTNKGFSRVNDLRVTLNVAGAALVGSELPFETYLDQLPPNKTGSFTLKILPTSNLVTLTIALRYVDEAGSFKEEHVSITLPVATGGLVLVMLEPSAISSMHASSAMLLVRNVGEEEIYDATLYLSTPQGSMLVIEPSVIELGDVGPGGELRVPVKVKAPYGEAGARTIHYTLVYRGANGEYRTLRDSFQLILVEEANVTITAIEFIPREPSAGSTVLTSITLMNLGSKPLLGVNLSLALPPGLTPLRSPYQYVGQLSPYTPTTMPFSFNATRPGSYKLLLRVCYRSYYGEPKVITKHVTLRVVSPPRIRAASRGSVEMHVLTLIAATGVGLAILAIFAWRWRK